jgi:hypothetical protein
MASTQAALRLSSSGSSCSPRANHSRSRAASMRTSRSTPPSTPSTGVAQPQRRRSSAGRYTRPLARSSRTSRRMFVSCMATPSSSARAMFFSSPTDPPGWMITATTASAAASMPSGNG